MRSAALAGRIPIPCFSWPALIARKDRPAAVAYEQQEGNTLCFARQVSYEKQIAIIDKIMQRIIEYCKVKNRKSIICMLGGEFVEA